MSSSPIYTSPVAAQLPHPKDFASASTPHAEITIGDASSLAKLGLKGPLAAQWLQEQNISVPRQSLSTGPIEGGGLIARLGTEEFLLESGRGNQLIAELESRLGSGHSGVYRVERQDATFLLSGVRVLEVFAQTCGVNFRELPAGQVIFTRVAGVSCTILPQSVGELTTYRLWVDPSFAADLWHSLYEITADLGGSYSDFE